MQSIQYNLIVAMSKNNGIGFQGHLPWPFIKEDMQYFSKMTRGTNEIGTNEIGTNAIGTNAIGTNAIGTNAIGTNNCIIMGRNTWDSLPRALPKRDNLVLSSTLELNECMPDEHVIKSFNTLDDLDAFCIEQKYDTCWVIGGATIYKQFMERNKIAKCYITCIDANYECDVFFDFPEKEWHMISEQINEKMRETTLCETSLGETISETSLYERISLKFQIFTPR